MGREGLWVALAAVASALVHCSSAETANAPIDASSPTDGAAADTGAPDAASDVATDAPASGSVVTYTVPSGGGSVTVAGATQDYTLEFPASAGGKTITIQLVSPATFGLKAAAYRDFFKLGPSGTVFVDPVLVRPKSTTGLAPFAMLFPDGSTIGSYTRLVSGAFAVAHFSGLGFPAGPKAFCETGVSGPSGPAGKCQEFSTSTPGPAVYVQDVSAPGQSIAGTDCTLASSCLTINSQCCVPTADATAITDGNAWCPSDTPPNGFILMVAQTCAANGADSGAPAGCHVNATSTGPGCALSFGPACGKTATSASCNGTTCKCGAATFPQGAACNDGAAATTAVLASCP